VPYPDVVSLLTYQQNVYSQNGEDGILEELCLRLGLVSGWFCEFGAADGIWASNCRRLADLGWHGVFIEGNQTLFEELVASIEKYSPKVIAVRKYVQITGDDSLDAILAHTHIPDTFEVLSVDVDSFDWQIWRSLTRYRPMIVIIEVNTALPPDVQQIHNPGICQGSSFASTLDLAREKGYTLVCHTGNMIFVRNDRASDVGLHSDELRTPEILFNWRKHKDEVAYLALQEKQERRFSRRCRRWARRIVDRLKEQPTPRA
jgi:hypothetical protein